MLVRRVFYQVFRAQTRLSFFVVASRGSLEHGVPHRLQGTTT